MATQSSPESISREPVTLSDPPPKFLADGEFKENAGIEGRKPLPKIPIPSSSARIHGPLMSPVHVNVQPEDWPPNASVAVIDDGLGTGTQASRGSDEFQPERYNPMMPVTADIPYRPNVNSQVPNPSPGGASPGDSSSSRSPSNSSSNHTSSLRREHPERIDENDPMNMPVPRLQYHHQSHYSEGGIGQFRNGNFQNPSTPDLVEAGRSINRHLTPTSQMALRNSIQRPMSAYSDQGPRGRSPGIGGSPNWGARAPSAQSSRSDNRPLSYLDLTNMSYAQQQAPPALTLDNSGLRKVVGSNASLLSSKKTLEMYRQNIKKLNDSDSAFSFALLLVDSAREAGLDQEELSTPRKLSPRPGGGDSPYVESQHSSPRELLSEAKHILQKLADRSHPYSQYYLADGYASGLFHKGKSDYNAAFPLFIAASKHGHAESTYRAALCYEFGWGCGKDVGKAVQFYRLAASKNHPGAMTRLGRACLSGDLGLNRYREGLKWLKRATEMADPQYNAAPYHLGLLYETGYGEDLFIDQAYAAQLFTQAADLGHAEASFRMGDAYEHGKLNCPRDAALSVHFYNGAAQRGHAAAMMALCAWYFVGAPPVLEKNEDEAYEWARRAAEQGQPPNVSPAPAPTNQIPGLTKAEYTVGYFTEMGIGTRRDMLEANVWYVKAAEAGDERAKSRLAAIREAASGGGKPMEVASPKNSKMKKSRSSNEKDGQNDKDCVVM